MDKPITIGSYITANTHNGKYGLYNLITIETEHLDKNIAEHIYEGMSTLYSEYCGNEKKLNGKKNVLNWSKVLYTDASVIPVTSLTNTLGRKLGYAPLTLFGCHEKVRKFLEETPLKPKFEMVYYIEDL